MNFTTTKSFRKVKKLLTNPSLVFYNFFARRIGRAQISSNTIEDPIEQRIFENSLQAGINPWQVLCDRFNLRAGALTGRVDQGMLIDARKVLGFLHALVELSDFNSVQVKIYTLGSGVNEKLDAIKPTERGYALDLFSRLSARSDFVVELSSPDLRAVAAQIFIYDCSDDGAATLRSNRAFIKRFKRSKAADIYPDPVFGPRGTIVGRSLFPIDAVYTWVDRNDPKWQASWASTFPNSAIDLDRFTSNDELLYSIRSIAKFAPWVRRIFVLTNCARPDYIQEGTPLIWVDHEQVFPQQGALPTFNSHAIESCLHRIPGLSEHFIYFNDDILLNQPCYPSDFFTESGQSVAYLEPYGMVNAATITDSSHDYLLASRNSQKLLASVDINDARQLHQHVPYSLRVSTLKEIERKFSKRIALTRESKVRSKTDVNLTSFLYHHFALSRGTAIPGETRAIIIRPTNIKKALAPNVETSYKFLCFNDGNNSAADETYKKNTVSYFRRVFRETSEYELPVRSIDSTEIVEHAESKGVTVITYGTFDLFHEGHVRLLRRARALGSRLIVAISTDEFNQVKGKTAFMTYEQRKLILESCKYVDLVIPEQDWAQKQLDIRTYGADIFVMGDDWAGKFDELRSLCQVVYLERTEAISTTQIKNDLSAPKKALITAAKPVPRFDGPPTANFVFLAAGENLRALELEFSTGIMAELPNFRSTNSVRKRAPNAVNITFWINRPANIMMSHGVADKNYLTRRKDGVRLINKYDRVLVPGEWLKKKITATRGVEIDPNAIDIVGWPRLDALLIKRRELPLPTELRERRLRVLWAPTHAGRPNATSYPALEQHTDLLKSLFDFEVSTHPNDRKGGKPTFQALLDADVIIADQGTMLYEAWALGKTVVCPAWLVKAGIQESMPGSAEDYIYTQQIGNHAMSIDELVDMIRSASGPDERVSKFMSEYIDPSAIGHSYELIASSVRAVWNRGVVRHAPQE